MHIAFHIGANCTDDDRLLKSVLSDAAPLLQQGVSVPGPSKYRRLIREAIQALDGARPAPGSRDVLMDAILEDDAAERIVMSNDNFIAVPKRIFDHGVFYPQAEAKVSGLRHLFPDDQISLYLALRHPISFLQDVFQRSEAGSLEAYLGVLNPADLLWSDVVKRVRQAAPSVPLTIWCNEDTPLIWEDIVRAITGQGGDFTPAGRFDLLKDLLPATTFDGLIKNLAGTDPEDVHARQHLIADALESLDDDALPEDEINLPGVDDDVIAQASEAYESDVAVISEMDGLTVIRPFGD
ncbi:MAG: hypothetical protein AAFU41_11680 [Pseudomonadota bacterium]